MLMLAVHDHEINLAVIQHSYNLGAINYAVSDYDDQASTLKEAGIDKAWSIRSQTGIQFAKDVIELSRHPFQNSAQS